MAQEYNATLQATTASTTLSSIASAPISSYIPMFASSLVFLPIALGPLGEPPSKWVQVFIALSLESTLITSCPNVPPLSQPIDMLHT